MSRRHPISYPFELDANPNDLELKQLLEFLAFRRTFRSRITVLILVMAATQGVRMPEVHRIWRIVTSEQSMFEVELLPNQSGQNLVKVSEAGSSTGALSFLDVDTARTLSQAIFEACEVASALARQAAGRSPNPMAQRP